MFTALIVPFAVPIVVVLFTLFWKWIMRFLNGPVRNCLEKIFGQVDWYVKILNWLDDFITVPTECVVRWWETFEHNVRKLFIRFCQTGDGIYEAEGVCVTRRTGILGWIGISRTEVSKRVKLKRSQLPASIRDLLEKDGFLDGKKLLMEAVARKGIKLEMR